MSPSSLEVDPGVRNGVTKAEPARLASPNLPLASQGRGIQGAETVPGPGGHGQVSGLVESGLVYLTRNAQVSKAQAQQDEDEAENGPLPHTGEPRAQGGVSLGCCWSELGWVVLPTRQSSPRDTRQGGKEAGLGHTKGLS